MFSKLKPKSEFSRNVLTLMTGTTIAQAIPIAISPILTRLYTPEDFGIYALFISLIAIFGSIINGRYELAIMLPKKDEDAINILALGFVIAFLIFLFLLFFVIFFNDYLVFLLNNQDIKVWLYFIPFAVFFTGLYNLLNYYNNRKKYYKDISDSIIIKAVVTVVVQLSFGFLKVGVSGLVSGQLVSLLFANMKLLQNIIKNKIILQSVKKIKMLALAKKYKDFPKYSMPAILANTLTRDLTNIFISIIYNVSTLGFYSLVQRLLGMPSSLIGSSIGQVFFQEATKEKHETGVAIVSFLVTIRKLLIIGIPSFIFLYFIVENLFAFVFGEEWRIAGIYAEIVTPFFFIRFVVATVSPIDTVMERQNIFLLFNIVLLIMALSVIYMTKDFSFNVFLEYYTLGMGLIYILYGLILYKMAKNEFKILE